MSRSQLWTSVAWVPAFMASTLYQCIRQCATRVSFHVHVSCALAASARAKRVAGTAKRMTHQHHSGSHDHAAGHTHGIIDPSIATSERGLWAIKWSFAGLAATA